MLMTSSMSQICGNPTIFHSLLLPCPSLPSSAAGLLSTCYLEALVVFVVAAARTSYETPPKPDHASVLAPTSAFG